MLSYDFITNTGIAKYYDKIYELKTFDGVYTISLYKKKAPVPLFELENIANRFIEEKPDTKELVTKQYNDYIKQRKN